MDEKQENPSHSPFRFRPLSEGMGIGALKVLQAPDHSTPKKASLPTTDINPKAHLKPSRTPDAFEQEKKAVLAKQVYTPWRFRAFAHAIDFTICVLFACIVFWMKVKLRGGSFQITQALFVVYGLYLLYTLCFKLLLGRTPGSFLVSGRKKTVF